MFSEDHECTFKNIVYSWRSAHAWRSHELSVQVYRGPTCGKGTKKYYQKEMEGCEATSGPSPFQWLFLEPALLHKILLLCDYNDLPAFCLVSKEICELMDNKYFLTEWNKRRPILWECILRGSPYGQIRTWEKSQLKKLRLSEGRLGLSPFVDRTLT
jgi:hypothetical protein